MKKILFIFLAIIATVSFNSCDKNFEEINENVDDPTIIPSSMLIGTAVRDMINEMYSTFNGSEIGENWVQHNALAAYNDPDRYRPRVTSMDGIWNTMYGAASTANQMYELAVEEGNTNNQGIAIVLKSYAFLVLTDLYGHVPYSEALKGPSEGNFTPAYDLQEDVYTGVFADLDNAISLLSTGTGTIDPNMDILYYGDASGWLKFAASLKFRALMRVSGKMSVGAQLQALVDGGHLFKSNADEAKVIYTAASPDANPLYETIVEQTRGEHRLSQTFVKSLQDNNDPRLPIMANPALNSGNYVGKPNGGSEIPMTGYGQDDVSSIGDFYLQAQSPGYFMSYTQLLLLMAEAAERDLISGGSAMAQTYYEAAIQNSMNENTVGDAYAAYYANPTITYSSDETTALSQIGYQMWIALFCQGFEAWTEWRRTGYPALTLAADPYDGITEIPSRLRYNVDEKSVNRDNYNAAVTALGGDGDEISTKVWWMQ